MSELKIDLRDRIPSATSDVYVKRPVSDEEAQKLNMSDIKKIIKDECHRKEPDLVWLRQPAMWCREEMYEKYRESKHIYPVNIEFRYNSCNIVKETRHVEIVQRAFLENKSNQKGTFHAEMSVNKNVALSNSITNGSSIAAGLVAGINIKVFTMNTSFTYTTQFSESHSETQSVTLGISSGVDVELEPHKKVEVQLIYTRIKQTVNAVYRATPEGFFTVAYYEPYDFNKDNDRHNIWFVYVPSRHYDVIDTFEVDEYGESQVVILDGESGQELAVYPLSSEQLDGSEPVNISLESSEPKAESGD